MIKRTFILLLLIVITVYLVAAVTFFNAKPDDKTCTGMELVICDSIDHGFISEKEITRLLAAKKALPTGKKMSKINTRLMEEILSAHPLIQQVECYFTPGTKIGVEITQRIPILRVMASNGENYYVDIDGHIMPTNHQAAYVAVVTGMVDKKFASTQLYKLGLYLRDNPLWNAQIEQINITPSKEIELVPRVGNHIIFLGKPKDYDKKFERLKVFYEKGLNKVGWNKYSRISLEFSNQIICTKKE